MIDNLSSYTVADFIPFNAEVYFRLIERVSAAWWPLHLLTLAAGLAAVGFAWTGRARTAGSIVATAMAWVGVTFLMDDYAQLNWAGIGFGWGFVGAATLLLLFSLRLPGVAGHLEHGAKPTNGITFLRLAGLALATFGVAGYPAIAPLAGGGWTEAEVFGIHPDPTAVAALGIVLLILHGYRLWVAAAAPLLWCLVSALTLQVLQAPWAVGLYVATSLALFGMILSARESG